MELSRGHFEALAAALKNGKPTGSTRHARFQQWLVDVQAVQTVCAAANPKFDPIKFVTACGL